MQNYKNTLSQFLLKLTKRDRDNDLAHDFSVVTGRKFDKIVMSRGNHKSVYAFIKKENGAIVKPASWKAPEPKQYERGNIFADDPLKGTSLWGVEYLK